MESLANPSQSKFVRRFVDWECINDRRLKYPAIGRAFDLKTLKDGLNKPPYYCHYMAWRLGTWEPEGPFERLEELLLQAELLPNWENERPLLISPDFANFWALMWQLQVAEYLIKMGSEVQWAKSGPDLSVVVSGERWFVECYTYQKSFSLLEFLEELLGCLDSSIHCHYDLCMPFQLPHNSKRTKFLDTVIKPFLNPSYLADAKVEAEVRYPVILYKNPSSSLIVYVEDNNANSYVAGVIPNRVGSPEDYLKVALREAANAKRKSNALEKHRPNLIAVNYLLSRDYQLAQSLQYTADEPLVIDVAPAIDGIAVSVVGIDKRLTREAFKVVYGVHSKLSRIGELAIVT